MRNPCRGDFTQNFGKFIKSRKKDLKLEISFPICGEVYYFKIECIPLARKFAKLPKNKFVKYKRVCATSFFGKPIAAK